MDTDLRDKAVNSMENRRIASFAKVLFSFFIFYFNCGENWVEFLNLILLKIVEKHHILLFELIRRATVFCRHHAREVGMDIIGTIVKVKATDHIEGKIVVVIKRMNLPLFLTFGIKKEPEVDDFVMNFFEGRM